MREALLCPRCGRAVPDDAPQALCPACVMRAGLGEASALADGVTIAPHRGATELAVLGPANAVTEDERATVPPRGGQDDAELPMAQIISEPAETACDRLAIIIPGYEIVGELGRGGMGVVYKARHIKLNRIVALKMILAAEHADRSDVARFRTEAEAIARLQHLNVVQVYEISEHQGKPFFSLEYCGGGSLAQKIDGTPWPAQDAARLVETLARAIETAHQKGIIHRDLKPANVLLLEDGTPKITDFGLAKKLDEAGQTQTGAVMGTPSYMAPEQAGGQTHEIGRAVDVYALGAVLYELLTGRPPFRAATKLDTVLQVLERDPAPPRLLNPQVDRDVETICLKCLEKNPRHRYASAQALADDLHRYQAGEAIGARSLNLANRIAFALERSQYDVQFPAYSRIFLSYALLMPVCEAARYVAYEMAATLYVFVAIETMRLAAILVLFHSLRPVGRRATGPAGRLLWSVWIGYVLTLWVVGWTHLLVRGGWSPDDEIKLYPVIAAVTGMAFYVLGTTYWGKCLAFGVAFHVLALVMTADLRLAPLEHGALWAIVLAAIGLRLRRLADSQQRTSGPLQR